MESNIQKLNVKKIEGNAVVGAFISDRVVFFSKTSKIIDSPVSFSISEEGNYKILLTDLLPGKWQVLKDNKIIISEAFVKADEGVIYLEGTEGNYSLLKTKK